MKSLTFRLTIWYACVVTVTVALVLWAGRHYLEANMLKGIDFLNAAEFEEVAHRLQSQGAAVQTEELLAALQEHMEIDAPFFFFQINGTDGQLLFKSDNLGSRELPSEMHGQKAISIMDEELGHLRVGEFDYNGLDVHIATSLQSMDALFADTLKWYGWIVVGVFVISLLLGLILSRVALNPVSNIQQIARRISATNLSERIPVPATGDEISRLSEFLNEMFDRLEKAFQQVSRFTADASHELRTPLSLIRLHGERLLNHPDMTPQERMQALAEQMAEIERLNRLIDDLLFLARADAGVLRLSRRATNIGDYLADFADDARALCQDRNIRFELVHADDAAELQMDPVWMRHVFLNLLSNALKVSSATSRIRLLSAPADNDQWSFVMEDEGPGLRPEQAEQIFDRFERIQGNPAEQTETGEQPGAGLGLAICRSIVDQHGGRIYARPREDRSGLRVHVELPR